MSNIKKDEKTNTYFFKISLGTDPVTGKRRQTTRRGFKKKSDAVKAYNELKNQYYDGNLIYNDSTKLKDFIDEYIKWYKTQVRKTTFENRIATINKNIVNYFGDYRLNQLTPIVIQRWQQELLDRGLDQNYVRSLHITFSQILERAASLGVINSNPAKKAGNVKRKKTVIDFWTEDELFKVLETMDLDNILEKFGHLMITFLFYTGVRFSEMQALLWSDFNQEKKSISITKDLDYKNQKEWVFDELKNESSRRTVILDDRLVRILLEWKEYQSCLFNQSDDTFIFSYNGQPTNKYFPMHAIERHSKVAGVHRIKTHALRHSHASFLINLGVNIIAIARRLGHTDVQEVLKTYGHLYPQHQFDVAENINDHINKKTGSNVGQ